MDAREFIKGMAATTNIQPIETQLDYADFVAATLAESGSAVVESDAGVGKTIAYLVNAMMYAYKHNKCAIIATSTASNRTSISDDIAKIQSHARAIGSPLAYLPAIDYASARDYCSLLRTKALAARLREVAAPNIVISQIEEIVQRVEQSTTAVLSEDVLPEPIIHNGIVIATREDISFGPADADSKLLGTMRAELESCLSKGSIILVTQAMLAKHRLLRTAVRERTVGCVVLDEVDRMLGLDFLTSDQCNMREVRGAIELLKRGYDIDVGDAMEALDALTDTLNAIRPVDTHHIMLARHKMDQAQCDGVIEKLRGLVEHFDRLIERFNNGDSIATTLEDEVRERKYAYRMDEMLGSMMAFVDNFTPPINSETFRLKTDTNVRLFIQWERDQPSLHVVTSSPGRSMMWLTTSGVPTIMTTGMVGSPMHQFAAQIGSNRRLANAEFRVNKFGDLKFVYFQNMPPPIVDNKVSTVYLSAVAAEIRKQYTPGQFMLVLCASYFDVQYFDEQLRDMPLITHVRGMKMHEMISRMASMKTGAIMLTVAWEGYNIVANDGTRRGLLDSVVISRLPFSAPRPMQLETLQTIFGEQKASSINWTNMRNEVVRRVYQGICRLVRGPDDRGEILIMDPRFPPNGVIRQMLPQLAPRPGHKEMIKAIPSRFAHRRHYDVRSHA